MNATIVAGTPLDELAAIVSSTLRDHGIDVVLSGGSAVSIYSANAYESHDLDFVATGLARDVSGAMRSLGFARDGRHWVHPETHFLVDFPPGPVAVGNEIVREFAEIERAAGVLRILSPTDCVLDRLTWFIHAGDLQCLDQAIEVARRQPVDMKRIEGWAERESPQGGACFRAFAAGLAAR